MPNTEQEAICFISMFGFDSAKFYQDLVNFLMPVMDSLSQTIYSDIKNGLKTATAKDDIILESSAIEGTTDYTGANKSGSEFINARIWSYAFAIMDSFGTGIGIDKSSPYLASYKGSTLWNPARTSYQIVGRPTGDYINIFGDIDTSSGKSEGKPVNIAKNYSPSYAIQKAEDWFMKNGETKVERRIRQEIETFIANNAYKYFRSGGRR